MTKNFRKKVPKRKLYSEYIKMMNGYLGLSQRETEIYSFLLKLDTEWRPVSDKDFKHILSATNRKLIIREYNIKKPNLSRMVADFKNMGLIVLNANNGYEISDSIRLDLKDKVIETTFTFEVIDDDGARQNN